MSREQLRRRRRAAELMENTIKGKGGSTKEQRKRREKTIQLMSESLADNRITSSEEQK